MSNWYYVYICKGQKVLVCTAPITLLKLLANTIIFIPCLVVFINEVAQKRHFITNNCALSCKYLIRNAIASHYVLS